MRVGTEVGKEKVGETIEDEEVEEDIQGKDKQETVKSQGRVNFPVWGVSETPRRRNFRRSFSETSEEEVVFIQMLVRIV